MSEERDPERDMARDAARICYRAALLGLNMADRAALLEELRQLFGVRQWVEFPPWLTQSRPS